LVFQSLIGDADTTNKTYKILYKGSLQDKHNLEYSIEIYEGEFEDKKIEDFLNSRINKRSILKSVLVDIESETPRKSINDSSTSSNKTDFSKNKISSKNFKF